MDMTALYKLSYGLYVLGVKHEDGLGGCIVDAVVQAAGGEAPVLAVACMKNNLTNILIKQSGEFTLSVLPSDVDPFVIGNFGFQSARSAEKWGNVPHTLKDGLPILDAALSYVRCRVLEAKELATHTLFLCEVIDAQNGSAPGKPLIYGDYQTTMKGAAGEAFKKFKESGTVPPSQVKWRCPMCGYVYDGDVPFEKLPDSWTCPLCGVGKALFEKV